MLYQECPSDKLFALDSHSAVARKNPVSGRFTAMLHCFGGGLLSCLLLAEPPLSFLANNTNILLASSIWYIGGWGSWPCVLVSQGYFVLPVQLLAAGMKAVTRTWKIVDGVTHANSHYKNGWIVMIAIGWARGAGGSIITNVELLVKGGWTPQADEWMKMSYPAKVTLLGSIIFTLEAPGSCWLPAPALCPNRVQRETGNHVVAV
ncbi:trimeric intracellular cation channel type B-like [Myotis myotis]|uniref:trimeric intracellular cation channel type B-like n=1 Tax=Myotis myotis TaxID=51298 RepID=UPI00174BCB4D|nr:trimeric intracellular cation channel type B-like [Myotis myotis]